MSTSLVDSPDDGNNFILNEENNNQNKSRCLTKQNLIRAALASIVIGFIIYVIVDSQGDQNVTRISRNFLQWVEDNPAAGVFAFIGVYFIATILFIPGSILTLGIGFVFANVFGLGLGVVLASIAVFVGASAGCIGAFLLGRYLLRDCMARIADRYPIMKAIDSALESKGLQIVFLMRLSPIVPFNASNYILGITAVSLRDYAVACFGMLPGTVFYVFLGSSAGDLVDSASSGGSVTQTIVVVVVGVVFGVAAVAVITYFAKKELKKIIDENESNEAGADIEVAQYEEGN